MPSSTPIAAPAGFVPQQALSFADTGGGAVAVSAAAPLPVVATTASSAPAISTALAGTASSATVAGPFTPQLGRDVRLTLSGSWTGNIQLLTSIDGGATKLPVTAGGLAWGSFTGNCNETVDSPSDSGATYYLQITPASGAVAYRLAQ